MSELSARLPEARRYGVWEDEMDAKEYLEQARFLDIRINAKLAQLDSLKHLLLIAGDAADDASLRGTQCRGNLPICSALTDTQKPADFKFPLKASLSEGGARRAEGVIATDTSPVSKILSLQSDINRDIDSLVNLKAEITRRIGQLSRPEYQTVLELRYLNFMPWEMISKRLRYSMPYLFKLHTRALEELGKNLEEPE
jgi:hypothetical protein